jgi:hypothetical protein
MRSWQLAEENQRMHEKHIRVECYAGYRADERPMRIFVGTGAVEVREVEDRWYSPGLTYFRVLMFSGERYVLRHDDAQDVWSIEGFRAGSACL